MTKQNFSSQLRPDRAVISVRGDGAMAFLHNLLTCDVAGLAVGSAAYGALLSPQGKIQHDVFVFNAGEQVLIDCPGFQDHVLGSELAKYRLRGKFSIEAKQDIEVGVSLEEPNVAWHYTDPRLPGIGYRMFAPKGTLEVGVGYDLFRLSQGLADSTLDLGLGNYFPHEANLDQLNGLSFSKGCYIGQEVVSRMEHRGTARSRILPIICEPTAPLKGTAIHSGDRIIGEVLSSSGPSALALIRIDRLAEAIEPLLSGAARVHVLKPDWVKYEVVIPDVAS
jgi:tRNA-modifying protein YgfZ